MSVVIPVYDAELYLGQAIASVLEQTVAPAEVIVVDDGSTDRSAQVAHGFGPPVRVLERSREGVAAALNGGVEAAQGDLLAFLDADDRWVPDKLERQLGVLGANPALDAVLGHIREFRSPDLEPEERARLAPREGSLGGPSRGTMLIRRDAFLRVGPFATDWTLGEFVDWYARAVDAGLKVEMLSEVVMERRLHRTNSGIRSADARTDYVRVLRAVLERRGVTGS